MDTFDSIRTKLETREFTPKGVSAEIKKKILEAGRLTGSGSNLQHWRFVLVENPDNLRKLAKSSTTGPWVSSANFAILVLTDPKYSFHKIDAGRATQDMQLAAWNFGVASGIYTGVDKDGISRDFGVPKDMELTMVLAFGYAPTKSSGRKNRKPLSEIAYSEAYGKPLSI
jgi:nitroreductase